MNRQMHLFKNDTWDLITLPKCHKIVHCKWVFIINFLAAEKHEHNLKFGFLPKVSLMVKVLTTLKNIPYWKYGLNPTYPFTSWFSRLGSTTYGDQRLLLLVNL